MRTISKQRLKTMLTKHRLWLQTRHSKEVKGKQADLSDMDLKGIDLRYANLSHVNLSGANLEGANLEGAYLINADLSYSHLDNANLNDADLNGANLMGADLFKAKIRNADLAHTNLSEAFLNNTDLHCAGLYKADLSYSTIISCDLTNSDLRCTNLSHTDLTGSKLEGTILSEAILTDADLDRKEQVRLGIILKEDLVGYKKAIDYDTDRTCIVELLIPKGSVVFSINNSKCRTNRARVVSIKDMNNISNIRKAHSKYVKTFTYEVGQEIEIEDFDLRYNIECSTGIHFFRTREEAERCIMM